MIVIRRMVDRHRAYTAIFLKGEPPKIFPTSDAEHARILQVYKQDRPHEGILNDFSEIGFPSAATPPPAAAPAPWPLAPGPKSRRASAAKKSASTAQKNARPRSTATLQSAAKSAAKKPVTAPSSPKFWLALPTPPA